jgi:hypothetical protein
MWRPIRPRARQVNQVINAFTVLLGIPMGLFIRLLGSVYIFWTTPNCPANCTEYKGHEVIVVIHNLQLFSCRANLESTCVPVLQRLRLPTFSVTMPSVLPPSPHGLRPFLLAMPPSMTSVDSGLGPWPRLWYPAKRTIEKFGWSD